LIEKKDKPWALITILRTSEYTMHVEDKDDIQVLICQGGSTILLYDARRINELHTMVMEAGGGKL
jgi:hypothetical protein